MGSSTANDQVMNSSIEDSIGTGVNNIQLQGLFDKVPGHSVGSNQKDVPRGGFTNKSQGKFAHQSIGKANSVYSYGKIMTG